MKNGKKNMGQSAKRKNVIKINLNEISKAVPPINDYPSRKEWEDACFKKLLKSKDLLMFLVTSREKHNLVMRMAALKEILAGKGPRQISRELYISLQTINAVKKAIAGNNYQSYFERSKKERKKKRYSPWPVSHRKPRKEGIPRRTKYGTIYLPY